MPGKFPKVFQKRKSSSDVLEGVNDRPVSTFRVLERPTPAPETSQAYSEKPTLGLRRKTLELRPKSEGNIDHMATAYHSQNVINRGSAGTQKSNSSSGQFDSSSGRFSSTSTLPSSVDGQDDFHLRSSKTLPAGSGGEGSAAANFLRNAGRKFSLGGKKSLQAAEQLRQDLPATPSYQTPAPFVDRPLYGGVHDLHLDRSLPDLPQANRARATTETSYASESTVTLGQSTIDKLELKNDDDGFGDLFAGIGDESRKPNPLEAAPAAAGLGRPLTENKSYVPYRASNRVPPPINVHDTFDAANSSALDSATSADGLIYHSPQKEIDNIFARGSPSPGQPQSPTSGPTRQNRPRRHSRAGSKGLLDRRQSEAFEDTDALLVNKSKSPMNTVRADRAPPGYRDGSVSATAASSNPWAEERAPPPVPTHVKAPEIKLPQSPDDDGVDQSLLSDLSFQALAVSADRIQKRDPSPPRIKPSNKVMTPAQFERYRKEQANRRSTGDDTDSESEKSQAEEEEEEDEIERTRRIAKQRQRQEAQLSVYRQSMMKITGEQPMGPVSNNTLRPSIDRDPSRLSSRVSMSSLQDKGSITPEADEEDEDVPLGILAAHGFPNRELNRPPNHVRGSAAAGIQYNSDTYPPPAPPSAAGAPTASGGNLPAFARNLPKDPFYGAGLVNQTDRQSFALGGGSPGSIYGGSNHSSPNLVPPPGGLVGVIASEERARAIRRGSPSKTFGYGAQDPNGAMPMPMQMQMPMPAMPQQPPPPPTMVGPEQQANIQMAQQMTQMMQMQMQWMQQMMAMQSGTVQGDGNMQQMQQMQQMMQQMQGMNGASAPGGQTGLQIPGQNMNTGRSSSMVNPPNFQPGAGMGQGDRSMSMMGGRAPSMMMGGNFGGPNPGYTPSIAPSERSNIGQPSRYRPVSTVPGSSASEDRSRTNSLSAQSQLGAFGAGGRASTMGARPSTSGGLGSRTSSNMINVRLVETRGTRGDDDDDEAGWEEMRKKKESKRGLWRLRKSHGKENVSPQPSMSVLSAGEGSMNSSRSSRSARKPVPAPSPSHDSSRDQQQPQHQETGLEGVFVPDLDHL